jgi:cephalosporin-C deacetylase-like acetyl esterase
MFMRNIQAFRYFKNHPLLNKKDYIFAGGSQGAMQACSMAAHTPEATSCDMFVPWFCDLAAGVNQNRLTGWRPEPQKGVCYYDTAVAGQFVKCPVSFGAGLGDYICPPSGQMALYNGIKSKKHMWFIQNKTHGYTPPEAVNYTVNF